MPQSGLTYLQITNAVLSRLRKSTASTLTETTYVTMVANTVNQVKTEIETAWRWRDLRDTYSVTATPGTTQYSLTSSGPFTVILDAWNITTGYEMTRSSFRDMNQKFFGVGQSSVQAGEPTQFLPAGLDGSYDLQVDVWPSPVTTSALRFNVYKPQGTLTPATSGATVILIPNDVLIEGTLARMLLERGDDGGNQAQMQEQIYRDLLASAISFEVGHDPMEVAWEPI